MTLAALLKSARKKQGLSLRQLAAKCGISHAHIHELEKETSANPSVSTIKALAEHLHISPIAILKACL